MATQMRPGADGGKLRRLAWREAALMVELGGSEVDMGVQLNIKNVEARRLAEELVRLTGRSMTDVVLHSLRAELAQVRRAGEAERREGAERATDFARLLKGSRSLWKAPIRDAAHGDLLYDADGQPR